MRYPILIMVLLGTTFLTKAQTSSAQGNFTVDAHIVGLPSSQIFLTYGGFHNSKIDTTTIIDGRFSFSGNVNEPAPAMVFTPDYKVRFDLYVGKGTIKIDGLADDLKNLRIQGPEVTNEFVAFNKVIMDNRNLVNRLNEEAYKMLEKKDSVAFQRMQKLVDSFYNKEFTLRRDYIQQHTNSFISAYELYAFSNVKTVKEAIGLYNNLEDKIRQSSQGQALRDRLNLLGRVQVGQPAPGFVQQRPDGKEVSMDTFAGKYLLVEFWASWCGPCRAENPNLLKAYNQYKDKGFTILGVSLDHSKDAWIKAINDDKLPWMQVSDLKGWNNAVAEMYGIKAVPANFLVSPEGKIIALDLRGDLLGKTLKEIL